LTRAVKKYKKVKEVIIMNFAEIRNLFYNVLFILTLSIVLFLTVVFWGSYMIFAIVLQRLFKNKKAKDIYG